jgi:hypothetical protein
MAIIELSIRLGFCTLKAPVVKKKKIKLHLLYAMEAQGGRRGKAPTHT